MSQSFKKSKIRMIIILCFVCLFLSFSVVKLTASAEEKSTYYIKVNKQQNCITVYEKDKNGKYTVPIKAMSCSTGSATPLGIYNTLIKYRWKLLMGDVWGQYSTRIVRGILFHSVWYYKMDPNTLSYKQYNKLGTSASHGCIRLTVEDAKWIYDNCKIGTTVEIYNAKNPGPLGKPKTLILTAWTGWDPTDPSKSNPFMAKMPTIIGATNHTINWGTKTDLLKGVKATSSTGTDISSMIKIEGAVDIKIAGKYKIKYMITDAIGRTKETTVTFKVKECLEKPKFKGVVDRSIGIDGIVDREYALEGVTAYLSTVKLSPKDIKVKIVQDTQDSYTISYKITGVNDLVGIETATVSVDTLAPVIKGVSHKELTLSQLESGKSGIKIIALKGIKVSDDYSTISIKQVKVTIVAKSDYAYNVNYKVADDAGNITSETVQFTYYKDVKIEGVMNHYNLPYGTEITEDYVKEGITATNSEGDCTDKITFKISSYEGGEYKVTYSIKNIDGITMSIGSTFIVSEVEPEVLVEEEIDTVDVEEIEIPVETIPK